MRKRLITLCWHRQMPLYIFSLRSRRLSHEIENDPFEEIYSRHELLSHSAEEEICSFIFMKLLKKHSILVAALRLQFVIEPYTSIVTTVFAFSTQFKLTSRSNNFTTGLFLEIGSDCNCRYWQNKKKTLSVKTSEIHATRYYDLCELIIVTWLARWRIW